MSEYLMDINDLFVLSKIRNTSYQEIVRELAIKKVTLSEYKELDKIRQKISTGYPLAYILENIEFLGRSYQLNSNVLIPRPETEEWVKNYIFDLKKQIALKYKNDVGINLIDLATGSGVIGLSIWHELGIYLNQLILSDISRNALDLAQVNHLEFSKHFSVSTSPKFILSDLFNSITDTDLLSFKNWDQTKLNILVANLPYLPDIDRTNLIDLKHEPEIALFSGSDGLDLFYKLIEQVQDLNLHFDTLIFELDPRNIFQASDFVKNQDFFKNYNISILNDFLGRNRVLKLDIL